MAILGPAVPPVKMIYQVFFMTYQVELVREVLEPERLSAGLVFSKPEIFRQEIFQGASVHEE